MIIDKMVSEHKILELYFTLQKEEDKIILKEILENSLMIKFTRICECNKIDKLKLIKYHFIYDYDKELKNFIEIE